VKAAVVAAILVAVSGGALGAHHSFAAEYDANQPITLRGEIVRVELASPHSWLDLDVKTAAGHVVRWRVEMAPPNNLLRRGVTQATLPVGERVSVDGYRARNGGTIVSGRQIRTAGGGTLFVGPSATGPPDP
jgi:hypothetical protein